jgi:hypothetical protein
MAILVVPDMHNKYGGTAMVSGSGSFPFRSGLRVGADLRRWGLQENQLCTLGHNYNQRDWETVGKTPSGLILLRPKAPLPGYPNGFEGSTNAAAKMEKIWLPQQEALYRQAAHLSASKGSVLGLNIIGATPGGHLPMIYGDVACANQYFRNTRNIVLFPLPSNDPLLWRNLRTYNKFPDDLDLPVILPDNKHSVRIDRALPAMHTIFFSAEKIAGQRTILEAFGLLCSEYRLFGLAEAHVDIPIVDVSWWLKLKGYQSGVRREEVLHAAAEVLSRVLQPSANISNCAHPGPDLPSFVAVAGMPIPQGQRMTLAERKQFVENVEGMVEEEMNQKGQVYPSSLYTVWSDRAPSTPDGFLRLQAVRVFPIKDRTAREYVDEMLA